MQWFLIVIPANKKYVDVETPYLSGKSYSLDEEIERRAIWEWNLMRVLKHNAYYESGNEHYTMELNFYADMVNFFCFL